MPCREPWVRWQSHGSGRVRSAPYSQGPGAPQGPQLSCIHKRRALGPAGSEGRKGAARGAPGLQVRSRAQLTRGGGGPRTQELLPDRQRCFPILGGAASTSATTPRQTRHVAASALPVIPQVTLCRIQSGKQPDLARGLGVRKVLWEFDLRGSEELRK